VTDPVARRRAQFRRGAQIASRLGYLLFGLAMVLFAIAVTTEFNGGLVAAITACLIVGSLLLAPAIVLGYAVKAAEREEGSARGE
jgi:hypothetical protein